MKLFNRLKLASSYLLKSPKAWGMPVEASIEITTACNLNCRMCPHQKINRPIKEMKLFLFEKIIKEMKDYAELIYLHGLGEPLLNKNLFKMIDLAKKSGLKVGISTNATLLDKKAAKKLLNSGIDYIIFAFDGATKKTYEKIRVGGNFIQVEQNIKYFLGLKKNKKKAPYVVIQFIKMPENEKEVDLFLKKWRQSGAEMVRIKPVVDFLSQRKPKGTKVSAPCIYPYRMINIYFDGSVVPCCEDNFGDCILGNIQKQPLAKIWNGFPARRLRQQLVTGKREQIDLCRGCRYPQPATLGILGLTLLDDLKVKKLLPFLERLPVLGKRMIIYD